MMLSLGTGIEIATNLGYTIRPHRFGRASTRNMAGVLPHLIDVAKLAIMLCEYDGTVQAGGGLRTLAQAQDNVRRKTGILNSLHRKQLDGYSHAIDLIALTPGKGVDWKNTKAFFAMAESVGVASAILNVPIRQGCDWNMNGKRGEAREWDWPHFEHPEERHMQQAVILLSERREALGIV